MPALVRAAMVTAAVVIAGCGSEVGQEAAERSGNPLVAAAGKSAEENTARLAISVTAPGSPITVTGEGVFDLVSGQEGQLRLEVVGEGEPPRWSSGR